MDLPVLPQDVIDEIISQVDENDASTLKSCSLVCRSFRRKAQKMLFNPRTVVVNLVNGDNGPSEPTNIVLIVKHAPHLIGYIEDLVISGLSIDRYSLDDAADLVDALSVFSRKGEFSINLKWLSLEDLSWSYIDLRLQHALVLLTTVSSLQNIHLGNIMDCPANLVQNFPPLLKYLTLQDINFSSLPSTTIRKELPKLESLTVAFITPSKGTNPALDKFPGDLVERIVDVTQLKAFAGGDYTPYTMPLFEQILRSISNSLEQLTLEQIKDSDSISLDLNRLTDITIAQLCFLDDCISMFILITKTIKKISYRNVIQNISFCLSLGQDIDIEDFELAMDEYGVWQEMDTIYSIPQLASSKSFRGITFSMESTASDCVEFWYLIQNKLPKTREAHKLHIETSLL